MSGQPSSVDGAQGKGAGERVTLDTPPCLLLWATEPLHQAEGVCQVKDQAEVRLLLHGQDDEFYWSVSCQRPGRAIVLLQMSGGALPWSAVTSEAYASYLRWRRILQPSEDGTPPAQRWIEASSGPGGYPDLELHAE